MVIGANNTQKMVAQTSHPNMNIGRATNKNRQITIDPTVSFVLQLIIYLLFLRLRRVDAAVCLPFFLGRFFGTPYFLAHRLAILGWNLNM